MPKCLKWVIILQIKMSNKVPNKDNSISIIVITLWNSQTLNSIVHKIMNSQ